MALPPAGAFLLKENGSPQKILGVNFLNGPQSVCVLMDSSGSMYSNRTMALSAASHFVESLPADDDVCVATFAWRMQIRQPLTQVRQRAVAALKSMAASGGTAMYDAVSELSQYMRTTSSRSSSRAIVIFTDGADNASAGDAHAAVQMQRQLEIPGSPVLHIVCIQNNADGPSQQRSDRKAIFRMTVVGGGLTYFPRNVREVDADVNDLAQVMQSRLVLTYITGNQAKDGHERLLDVKLDKGHGGSKAIVRAAEGYYAPSF